MKKIKIVAPAGKTPQEDFNNLISFLNSKGYEVSYSEDIITNEYPYHSNSDEFRAEDFINALEDETVDVIWCLRGGYGSARLYEYLQDVEVKGNKTLIGFSDITALHLMLESLDLGVYSIHSHVLTKFKASFDQEDAAILDELIFDGDVNYSYELTRLNNIDYEDISGPATGGNLCVITTSLGTEWQIDADGKVLFLEDIGESGYKIDRMLNHMLQAGAFEGVKAIIFGEFSDCDANTDYALARFAESMKCPVFKCDNFGHGKYNYPFVYGEEVSILDDIAYFDF